MLVNPFAPLWLRGGWVTPVGTMERYHEYAVSVSVVAGGESIDNEIRTDGDSCFLWRATGVRVRSSNDTTELYMWIKDNRGQYLSNSPVRCLSFGSGENAAPFATEFVIPPGASLFVSVFERGGLVDGSLNLKLIGVKQSGVKDV